MSHGYPGADGNGYPDDTEYDEDGFPRRLDGPHAQPPQQGGGGGWPQVRNNPGPSMYAQGNGQGQQGNGYPQAYPQNGNPPQQTQGGGWPQLPGNRRAQGGIPQAGIPQQQGGYAPQEGARSPGAAYPDASYANPGYAEPGYPEPGYAEPGHAEPGFAEPGFAEPGYAEPGRAGPSPAGPAYGEGPTTTFPQQEETPAFARSAVGAQTRQQPAWGRAPEAGGAVDDPYGPGTSAWPEAADPASAPEADSGAPGAEAPDKDAPEAAPKKPGRDRYLDLLRSIALVRVVLFHVYNQAWMTVVFPSMGVMFALAGSLMARSLGARSGAQVIKSRIRRLMVPVWVFSIVTLALIFNGGWKPTAGEDGDSIIWWWIKLAWWFVPVGAPTGPAEAGSEGGLLGLGWAEQTSGPLWYIRAYLWFVVLSPLMLKAFKKLPWVTMLAPLGISVVIGLELVQIPGETGNAIKDFSTFASCWILGFAHNEGTLKKLKAYMIPSFAAVLMGLGLWWAGTHPGEVPWNFDEIAVANALWSLGFCAVLLHYSPSWQELPGKLKGFDTPITLANNRAVTIYLWHEMAIMLAIPVIDQMWGLPVVGELISPYLGKLYQVLMFILAWPLIAVAIASFGWAEDVAAKRKPRLWPNGAKNAKGAKKKSTDAR
ncbi:acyltransferase family protein [Streptomyces sp. NPDC058657]|uniref:acyltransferase family protein n=1 Tax=unclassified Streptomyces TaxID=2593676 RepID=UPI0036692CDA